MADEPQSGTGPVHCALETRWQRFGQFLNDLQHLPGCVPGASLNDV